MRFWGNRSSAPALAEPIAQWESQAPESPDRGPRSAVRAWAGRSQFSGVIGNTSKRKNLRLQAPEDAQAFSRCEVKG